MKKILFFCLVGLPNIVFGQADQKALLKELAESSCLCIDSISVGERARVDITKDVNKCVDKSASAYFLGLKLFAALNAQKTSKDSTKINLTMDFDKNSDEYKAAYYEMERYVVEDCKSLRNKVSIDNTVMEGSTSSNPKALDQYDKGVRFFVDKQYAAALPYFKEAVKIDPKFAFAWDNVAICYNKIKEYDKALAAYEKSLKINPKNMTPLQNIPIVYIYKEQYQKAIDAYSRLEAVDKNNPEVFYGKGLVYTNYMKDYENGLRYMCKAYNIYVSANSPYRTDCESIIGGIYAEMKKAKKEKEFNAILKENHITPNMEKGK